jgi:hypothetical protein
MNGGAVLFVRGLLIITNMFGFYLRKCIASKFTSATYLKELGFIGILFEGGVVGTTQG